MTRRDLLWLIRKPGHGHLPVPDEPVTRRRPWRGGFFELAASIRGHNSGGGFIELLQRDPHTGQDQTSYTATLVVADEPPRQVFNARRAWSKKLARLAVPAEISWRYSLIPPKQWKRLADRAVENVEDESKDREKAGAEPDDSFEARRDQAAQIKRRQRRRRPATRHGRPAAADRLSTHTGGVGPSHQGHQGRDG